MMSLNNNSIHEHNMQSHFEEPRYAVVETASTFVPQILKEDFITVS